MRDRQMIEKEKPNYRQKHRTNLKTTGSHYWSTGIRFSKAANAVCQPMEEVKSR